MPAQQQARTATEEAAFSADGDPRQHQVAEALQRAREEIESGRGWFDVLLDTIAGWTLPAEVVEDREYHYLVGGEAFDWLLLAERLTAELHDLIPEDEHERLVFDGRPPYDMNEDEFRERIGHRKYRAHLNYLYGVTVEESLQLAVEEEVLKDRRAYVWSDDGDGVFSRIYGKSRLELYDRYCQERNCVPSERVSFDDQREFTYWLFKFRIHWSDPAKVASDTRKGLAQLSRIESAYRARPAVAEATPEQFIEV